MPDYIKMNSKTYNKKKCVHTNKCSCMKFQSYDRITFGENIKLCSPISCRVNTICNNNNYRFQQYVNNQQNIYARMRRFPEQFPIIPWTANMNLNPYQQRAYSNIYYRALGTSNALPVNDNWGGFYVVGSEVPYTN